MVGDAAELTTESCSDRIGANVEQFARYDDIDDLLDALALLTEFWFH